MIPLTAILLLAASTRVQLVDEVYQIPASEWRYVELGLKQLPVVVSASYDVQGGSRDVRLILMRTEDLERMRSDDPFGVIAVTAQGPSGHIDFRLHRADDYVVVVDNRTASTPAAVHLSIWLDFGVRPGPDVTRISPRRRLTVILVSFAVFFGIVTYSARRLWRVLRH